MQYNQFISSLLQPSETALSAKTILKNNMQIIKNKLIKKKGLL